MKEFVVTPGLPADWDAYAGDGPAAGRGRWIEFGQSWFPGPYRTFALRRDGECRVAMGGTVLPAPAAVPRRDAYHMLTGRTSHLGLFADGTHPWPADLDPDAVHPCLMLMYPNYVNYPVGSHAGDPDELRQFVAELVGWARQQRIASIAVMYLAPRAEPLLAELARAGFTTGPMGERCDLPVTWADFDGYLLTLPRKYREEARREIRQMDNLGLTRSYRPLGPDEPELLDLRCALIEKYDGSVNRADQAAIFDMIRKYVAHEDITVFTMSKDDRLLSFSLFIQDGPEWTGMLAGSAYDDPAARFGYFSCVFYQPAGLAPARGVELLAYGYGSLDTKRRRGARLSPFHAAALRL